MKKIFFLLLAGCMCMLYSPAQYYRYINNIFPANPTKISNVVYDTAPFLDAPFTRESQTTMGDLEMDIYMPTGDTSTRRALVIFVHGGGFVSGNRNHMDMVEFCDSLARKGYVTATISYRIGANILSIPNSSMHFTRAVYRGVQDGRSAIRYFRANAATYGIDPNHVYMAGSSAGAFVGLNSLYFDLPGEKPTEAGPVAYMNGFIPENGPNLGEYDRGQNIGFSGVPDGVIGLWGAVPDTSVVQIGGTSSLPVFLIHGMVDGTVPFGEGNPFGIPFYPTVQGSELIDIRLGNLGNTNYETYFVAGEDHEFYGVSNGDWTLPGDRNAYWDLTVEKSVDFLWRVIHKPTALFSSSATGTAVNFTDLSTDALQWVWDFGDGDSSFVQFPLHDFGADGTYPVTLYVENGVDSWDTLSMDISVSVGLPVIFSEIQANRKSPDEVWVEWKTASEINNEGFYVERKHDFQPDFQPLGFVEKGRSTDNQQAYQFISEDKYEGTSYYRIKSMDKNGEIEYSSIVSVEGGQNTKFEFEIFPNPISDKTRIRVFNQDLDQSLEITIWDIEGKMVSRQELAQLSNSEAILDLSVLPKGLYYARLLNGGKYQSHQIMKN